MAEGPELATPVGELLIVFGPRGTQSKGSNCGSRDAAKKPLEWAPWLPTHLSPASQSLESYARRVERQAPLWGPAKHLSPGWRVERNGDGRSVTTYGTSVVYQGIPTPLKQGIGGGVTRHLPPYGRADAQHDVLPLN